MHKKMMWNLRINLFCEELRLCGYDGSEDELCLAATTLNVTDPHPHTQCGWLGQIDKEES